MENSEIADIIKEAIDRLTTGILILAMETVETRRSTAPTGAVSDETRENVMNAYKSIRERI